MGEIIVGIDIGTSKVSTLIGRVNKANQLEILGKGTCQCSGVKKGVIVDIESTSHAVKAAVQQAEASSNLKVGSAYINIIGSHVSVISNKSMINISNDTKEITKKDVERAVFAVKEVEIPEDRQLIDVIPKQYIVDGYDEIVDPVGMAGTRLEIEADIIAGKITSVQNIVKSVERAGIRVDGLVVEALALSDVALTPDEKEIGCVLIDVGAGIADVSVFKNRKLMFYDSVPVGGDHITNDISMGIKVLYPEAEKIKRQYELALTSLIKNDQEVIINDINENKKKAIKVSDFVEIIEARVYEIFALCKDMLEKSGIGPESYSSVIITGGGVSYIDGCMQLANEVFEVPVRVAAYRSSGVTNLEYATSAGIVRYISNLRKSGYQGSEVRVIKQNVPKKKASAFERFTKFIGRFF